jgi:hypothetical protein
MLNTIQKINFLEYYLLDIKDNYADSFKSDIHFYFNDFDINNPRLKFLEKYNTEIEITNCIDNLTSHIVLKFKEDEEQLSDFIYYFLT